MQGGGPSPSGSNFRHSYGLAAVSSAHTSARGRFPANHVPKPLFIKVVRTQNTYICVNEQEEEEEQ